MMYTQFIELGIIQSYKFRFICIFIQLTKYCHWFHQNTRRMIIKVPTLFESYVVYIIDSLITSKKSSISHT